MSAVTLRPAEPRDRAALGRLGAILVAAHHGFDAARFMPATDATAAGYGAWLEGRRERPDMVLLVAEQAGAVIGYVYAGIEGVDWMALRGPAGVIHDLVVDPAHRRDGVGRMLLEAGAAELTRRGSPRVVLSTAARNEAAQALFAGAGFRPTMIEMTREA